MSPTPKPAKLLNARYVSIFVINTIINIGFYMVSGVMSLHVKSLGISIADTGTIMGAMSIAAMVARPFSGWISDALNRKLVFSFSLFFICVSMVGYGFAKTTAEFILLRVLHGVSFGICTTVLMALIAEYIPEGRLGEGMGYFGLGQTLAVAVGPAIGLSIGNRLGFSLIFFLSGGFLAAAMVFALIAVGSENTVAAEKKSDAKTALRLDNFFAKEALLFGVFSIAIASTNGLEGSLLTLFGKQLGMENIGWYFTICAACMFISRLIFGRVMDKKGFLVVFYPGMAMMAAAMVILSMAYSAPVAAFIVAAVLKSLGIGTIMPALQAECIKAVKPEKRGAASSTFYFGADIGQGTSPIIGGAVAQYSGYSAAFLIYTIPLVLITALYGVFQGIKKRRIQSQV